MAILIMAGREVLCFIVKMGSLVMSELMMGTAGSGVDISGVSHRRVGTKVRSKGLFIQVPFVEATVWRFMARRGCARKVRTSRRMLDSCHGLGHGSRQPARASFEARRDWHLTRGQGRITMLRPKYRYRLKICKSSRRDACAKRLSWRSGRFLQCGTEVGVPDNSGHGWGCI